MRKGFILFIILFCFTSGYAQRHFSKYDDTFRKYSKRFFGPAFDWKVFKAQGIAESALSPDATSQVGARGVMQLMPATFKDIQSKNPEFSTVDDPDWNTGAGIYYDRFLYKSWTEVENDNEKLNFTFGSYNAGKGTILKAQSKAKDDSLDHKSWGAISNVAHKVPKWRFEETLNYVERIKKYHKEINNSK